MSQHTSPPGWENEPPHLLIRASAGSGKTYRLSARYLKLLRQFDAPESILATTFTRKAAGEVLGRVVTWLAQATTNAAARDELSAATMGGDLSREDCLAMLRRLAGEMHRLSISTIDGFFNRIAQSFAHELDLPPEPVLIDESHPTAVQIRRDAIESMLADADLPALVTLLRQFHHDHAARSVTQAIDDIIKETYEVYREAPQQEAWARLEPTGLLDEDGLQAATQVFLDGVGDLPDNKHWINAYADNREAALARDWELFIGKGIAGAIAAGKVKFQRLEISDPIRLAFDPLIGHARAKMIERVALQTIATHDLLRRFDEHYTTLRRRQGVLLFSDLTHKLARELPALGDGALEDIYYRLDARVTHLLLDEFQDTSLAQWDVLRPFAQEVSATADGERSLLVVGDAKQAIYGWRGGVAELFDQIEDELALDPESIQSLTRSYRSSGNVLEAVNRVFTDLTTNPALDNDSETAERWQRSFEEHAPARDLSGHVTLETSAAGYNPDDDDDGDNDSDSADMWVHGAHEPYVAQRVKALYERDGGAGSIGVLVSTNKAASRLIFEIGRLGLPVSGEGGGSLPDTPAVSAVLSALALADHPGDTASAFHVLNSPLAPVVGLESMQTHQIQRSALNIRTTLLTRGYAQTLADWTHAVAPSLDARGLTRLTQLIELADQFDPGDALRPSRFVALAESQRVAEPSPAAIRVMTIHGAKGLEFDTVVLAELDKRLTDRSALLIEREHPTAPIIGVYRNARQSIRDLDDRLERAAAAQRSTRLMDDLCALYVGMTRPRQALHLIVKPRRLTPKGKIASIGLCYAAILREALSGVEETLKGEQVLFEIGNADWTFEGSDPPSLSKIESRPVNAIELNKGPDTSRRFWPTVSPSSRAGGTRTAADLLNISLDIAGATRYGTLIHAWMEQVGFINESGTPDNETLSRVAHRLMPGTDPAWLDSQLERFYRILTEALAQQVLSRNGATDLWRERPFAVRDGRELLRGCFDRVSIYRDDTGRATRAELLDFKSDRVGSKGVKLLVVHYRPQMLAYQRALKRLLGLDSGSIQTRLWFVGAGELAAITG